MDVSHPIAVGVGLVAVLGRFFVGLKWGGVPLVLVIGYNHGAG
jgi:hypothetical protein